MLNWIMNPVDTLVKSMTSNRYPDNPYNVVTAITKLQPKNMVEACIRAATGTTVDRPLGSPNVQSPWEKVFLNPRQLFQLPPTDVQTIETRTVIGKRARRPLTLDIPIMVTGMSYGGSLALPIKRALARGAAMAGTSTNTGESAVTNEERDEAKFLVGQYHRGGWLNTPDQLERVDAVEIQLGQGAWGGAVPSGVEAKWMDEHLRAAWHVSEGEDATIEARLKEVQSPADLARLVKRLRSDYPVPVGIKIAGTHWLERELAVVADTEADYIVIDGSEGGTANSMCTLQDDVGLPTLFCIARASSWLEDNGLRDDIDVILAGGLRTPGEFLKAMALGADAVYIGSIALTAALADQITKALPDEMIAQLEIYNGRLTDQINIETSARNLARFLISCTAEMKHATLAVGKESVHQLGREDLCCVDYHLAEALRVGWAGVPAAASRERTQRAHRHRSAVRPPLERAGADVHLQSDTAPIH